MLSTVVFSVLWIVGPRLCEWSVLLVVPVVGVWLLVAIALVIVGAILLVVIALGIAGVRVCPM